MKELLKLVSRVNRPTLGEDIPVVIFRAFRIFSGEYVKDIVGKRGASVLFQNAGRELGKEIGASIGKKSVESYLDDVVRFVKDTRIGILIPVEVGKERSVLRLDECITCSGMPNIGERICHFEVGFVAGVFEHILGRKVKAFETKCNANGEGTCEVVVHAEGD